MYSAVLEDKREVKRMPIDSIPQGTPFIFGNKLMIKTSSNFAKYQELCYGVVVQAPDPSFNGATWLISPNTLVDTVKVEAKFTIVE